MQHQDEGDDLPLQGRAQRAAAAGSISPCPRSPPGARSATANAATRAGRGPRVDAPRGRPWAAARQPVRVSSALLFATVTASSSAPSCHLLEELYRLVEPGRGAALGAGKRRFRALNLVRRRLVPAENPSCEGCDPPNDHPLEAPGRDGHRPSDTGRHGRAPPRPGHGRSPDRPPGATRRARRRLPLAERRKNRRADACRGRGREGLLALDAGLPAGRSHRRQGRQRLRGQRVARPAVAHGPDWAVRR